MKNIDMKFTFTFDLWTEPKWIKDHGQGTVTVSDASIIMNLLPENQDGFLHIEFYETAFKVGDYDVEL